MIDLWEKQLVQVLAFGLFFTTILVVTGTVTDPVNTPKLVSLGVFSASTLLVITLSPLRVRLKDHKLLLVFILLFILSSVNSVLWSGSPLSQNIYGSYGRNNGLLAYLFLASTLLVSLTLRGAKSFERVLLALIWAGIVNIVYCGWVLTFGDFIRWSNPYGNILGTFGNPNFIGSFLGIFFGVFLAYTLGLKSSQKFKFIAAPTILLITAYETYASNAIQGRVLIALSIGIIGFFLIRARFGLIAQSLYTLFGFFVGMMALLGTLQIGPLTVLLYKYSVSLRGQYWLAGWNTGTSHPWSGVGMDAFGDWYRRTRDVHALEVPGVNTIVNTAHNVPMDMFAFGGLPLLVTYLAITGMAAWAIIRLGKRNRAFNWIQVALTVGWMGYQLQSIISINQIGLAIWGWVLSGALISYERNTRGEAQNVATNKARPQTKSSELNVQAQWALISFIGALVGLLIALPALSSDIQWRKGQESRSLEGIEASMKSSHFNPQNSNKFVSNIQILEASNFPTLAHQYALEAVKWNPEAFDLWKVLYLISESTQEEKDLALENMKRLDPLNQDVTSNE